jgi:membrane protein YdbS with pleckstrin-like domain
MADNRVTPSPTIDQITTLDVGPAVTPVPPVANEPHLPGPGAETLYGSKSPDPAGTTASEVRREERGSPDPINGIGSEGEEEVWIGRYSMRNFLGRAIAWGILTVLWVAMAIRTWGYDHTNMAGPTIALGVVLVILWLMLFFRMAQAWLGHHYRLTTRRLFVSTGIANRERDQLELLRVQDIYVQQPTLLHRWLSLGNVVIVSSEKNLPNYHLVGVSNPKGVQDLIWHHARAEQDQRNVRVEQI